MLFFSPLFLFGQSFKLVNSVPLKSVEEHIGSIHGNVVVAGSYGERRLYSLDGNPINNETYSNYYMGPDEYPIRIQKKTALGMKYGSIGLDGKIVNPFVYDEIDPWLYGYAISKKGNNYFMIDTLGREYQINGNFEKVAIVMDGVAWCRNADRNYGLIDKEGKMLADMKYSDISWLSYKNARFQDLAIIKSSTGSKGLIDKNGKIIIPLTPDMDFTTSKGKIYVKHGKRTGILQKDYTIDYSCKQELDGSFTNMIGEKHFEIFKEKSNGTTKYGIVDTNCNVVIPAKFNHLFDPGRNNIFHFYERFPISGGASGVINIKGDTILDMLYKGIIFNPTPNDILATKNKNEWYWFDINGQQILPFSAYNIVKPWHNPKVQFEAMPVKKDEVSEVALYNRKGELVSKEEFEEFSYTECNLYFLCKKVGKYGLISVEGDVLLPCEYETVQLFLKIENTFLKEPLTDPTLVKGFIAEQGGRTYIYDTKGKKTLFDKEGKIAFYYKDFLWVKKKSAFEIYKIKW